MGKRLVTIHGKVQKFCRVGTWGFMTVPSRRGGGARPPPPPPGLRGRARRRGTAVSPSSRRGVWKHPRTAPTLRTCGGRCHARLPDCGGRKVVESRGLPPSCGRTRQRGVGGLGTVGNSARSERYSTESRHGETSSPLDSKRQRGKPCNCSLPSSADGSPPEEAR